MIKQTSSFVVELRPGDRNLLSNNIPVIVRNIICLVCMLDNLGKQGWSHILTITPHLVCIVCRFVEPSAKHRFLNIVGIGAIQSAFSTTYNIS